MEKFMTESLSRIVGLFMPGIVFLLIVLSGFILRKILFARLQRWAGCTQTHIDDIVISSTKGPFMIWCVMLGIYYALEVSKLPVPMVRQADRVLAVLGIISVTMVVSNFITRAIRSYSQKAEGVLPVTSLTQNIARIVIFVTGLLVILHNLGISIVPILATLGVGGIAVALALQDTFANLFAGFIITVNKQLKVGDYVRLDGGQEGYIADINWRVTKIMTLPNNLIFVPNSKITQSIITNYYLPTRETDITVSFEVHYDSDLDKVERVAAEVGKDVMDRVSGGIAGFHPVTRFNELADSGITCVVAMRVRGLEAQHSVKHEFIKRLIKRFREERIVIPYPVTAVNFSQEKPRL
ncbi:MAG: mechanosensitive ion channel family protein [Candidatus Omnitrophota bacterium]